MASILLDLSILIITATILALIARFFKQPIIPAYIIAGILIGPVFKFVTDTGTIMTLAEIGIAFLLFIVGLEINLNRLKFVGFVSSLGGAIQVIVTASLGFALTMLFRYSTTTAYYIGLVVAFSSTMIVIKILSDKQQLDTLHGRIIVGILLMQDIIAVLALIALTTANDFSYSTLMFTLLTGLALFLSALVIGELLLTKLFKFAAKSQELLFLLSLSVCFLFVVAFGIAGFSIAIGAFVGGIILANLPYSQEIVGKIKPLRNFFSMIFFIALGLGLTFMGIDWMLLAVLLLIVLAVKMIITMLTVGIFGYKKRTSFLTGLSLAQTSEFSLILVAQGLILQHISKEIYSLVILLAIITITLTTYFINFDSMIYNKLKGFVKIAENAKELEYLPENEKYEVVLCGYNRIGYGVVKAVKKMKKKILIIDYNPDTIKKLIDSKILCIYGDISDPETLDKINFRKIQILISTVPDLHDNLLILKKAKTLNKRIIVFSTEIGRAHV